MPEIKLTQAEMNDLLKAAIEAVTGSSISGDGLYLEDQGQWGDSIEYGFDTDDDGVKKFERWRSGSLEMTPKAA